MTTVIQKVSILRLPMIRYFSEALAKQLNLLDDRDQPDNEKLSAKFKRSIGYESITVKSPLVIDHVIKGLKDKEAIEKKLGDDKKEGDLIEEIEKCSFELHELKDMILYAKTLSSLVSSEPDIHHWNNEIDKLKSIDKDNLFSSDLIFAESYIHRKIMDIFASKSVMSSWDPYIEDKQTLLNTNMPFLEKIAKRIIECKMLTPQPISNKLFCDLSFLMKMSVWGNRYDLLNHIEQIEDVKDLVQESESELDRLIISNHMEQAFVHILSGATTSEGKKIVDYILGNAGVEMVIDLMVADFLVTRCQVDQVRFHVKPMPWFVSAATRGDLFDAIKAAAVPSQGKSSHLAKIAKKWPKLFTSGDWTVCSEQFWCLFKTFDVMKEEDPEIYQTLGDSHLAILKGDLNYRKLCGDRMWVPEVTTLSKAVEGWGPCPALALRAIKSPVLAGFSSGDLLPDNSTQWYSGAKYALIQLYRP